MKGLVLLLSVLVWGSAAQRLPGPPPPASSLAQRLSDLRRKIEAQRAVDVSAQRALQYARRYLQSAERALHQGQAAQAERLAAAADSLIHVAEHQEHLRAGGGPKGPPPPAQIEDHLHRVYFRTEQAAYFLSQARDSTANPLPQWARDFYELAARAYDRKEWVSADENAKCADEVVNALENLAQAASITDTVHPPPPKPPQP